MKTVGATIAGIVGGLVTWGTETWQLGLAAGVSLAAILVVLINER